MKKKHYQSNNPERRQGPPTSKSGGLNSNNSSPSDQIVLTFSKIFDTFIIEFKKLDLKMIFHIHSICLLVVGSFLTFMPHGIMQLFMPKMEHMAHEIYRLYGVLNFSIGWIVFKLRAVGDGRVGKLIAESFAVCYSLQTLVILRAQMTNPKGHDLWHWLLFIVYLGFAAIYSHLRFANGGNKIKVFELPGQRDHND